MWLTRGAQPSEQAASLLRSIGVEMHRPSAPTRKAEHAGADGMVRSAAKVALRRAKPRVLSARKAHRKAARKAARQKLAKV